MNDFSVNQLIDKVERLPDTDIIKAMATPDDYTIEAMVIYEAEADRRGIRSEKNRPIALQEAQKKKNKEAVAWSIKGIGAKFYGKRFFRADGSYQTTKWFALFHLPIYPISSLRVRPDAKGKISVLDILPIDRRQMIDTYCFVAIAWACLAGCFNLIERYAVPFGGWIDAMLFCLPFLFLYVVRSRDRKKVMQQIKT